MYLRTSMQLDWQISARDPRHEGLAREADIPRLLALLLTQRGVLDAATARTFLSPQFKDLLTPGQLPGALDAADRLIAAVRDRKRIVIYGDYDVDGVTATAILWHALRLLEADVHFYVPSRFEEGYGLNADALRKLAAEGARVVVTVDCGVTAVREAAVARELGLELIITDHHEPSATLPDVDVLVHPRRDGPSANPDLCGAGVALKIAWAIAQRVSGGRAGPAFRELLVEATALASLGLVADVANLQGENRIIAAHGLRQLCHSRNPGVQALIEVANLQGKAGLDDYDVGFLLAPRLNAIGRMGHAKAAVELFTRANPAEARQIASELDSHNRQRQTVERGITAQAEEMVRARGFDRAGCHGIVLASDAWHVGVVGIVAARLVERFCRPTVLIALENGHGQGSGRSVRHFPLHEVLSACGEHLLSHGGHAMAAGVRLRREQVEAFTRAFQDQAAQRLSPADLTPRLRLDDEVELAELDVPCVDAIQRMAPFGAGNPRPRLATGTVELADRPRAVGSAGQHLQFAVRQGDVFRKAIAFHAGKRIEELADHRTLRLAFEPILNVWNGQRRVELKVVDWQPPA